MTNYPNYDTIHSSFAVSFYVDQSEWLKLLNQDSLFEIDNSPFDN
jgi:hypothetical protein